MEFTWLIKLFSNSAGIEPFHFPLDKHLDFTTCRFCSSPVRLLHYDSHAFVRTCLHPYERLDGVS